MYTTRVKQETFVKAVVATGTTVAVMLSVKVWADGIGWSAENIEPYSLFPLFGLLAFSVMWSHYVAAAAARLGGFQTSIFKRHYELSGWAVFVLILAHPGLLTYTLWRDGAGTPPASVLNYVGKSGKLYVVIGVLALAVFLAYELKRRFEAAGWWKTVAVANDAAMLLIVLHGFRLGRHIQSGWYQKLWLFFGITLVASILYKYLRREKATDEADDGTI